MIGVLFYKPRQRWMTTNLLLMDCQVNTITKHAYIERYNRTVRYDWLNQYLFKSIEEVQDYATAWLWEYNNERPNMGIGGITPKQKMKMAA